MPFTYTDGIRFSCSRCGLCCGDTDQKTRHIRMLQSEAECLAQYTKKAIETFAAKMEDSFPYIYEMRKDQSGKCIFLKDNQCKVYDFRPMICCFYPFELSTRQDGIYVFSETDECPIICNPENSEVLTLNYFEELLKLAVEKFKGISNAEK